MVIVLVRCLAGSTDGVPNFVENTNLVIHRYEVQKGDDNDDELCIVVLSIVFVEYVYVVGWCNVTRVCGSAQVGRRCLIHLTKGEYEWKL